MKLKFIKKSIATLISCALLLVSLPHLKTFAALEDIGKLGGSYAELTEIRRNYQYTHRDDPTVYECHHLIAKEALNRWGAYIHKKSGINIYNYFLTDDPDQNWAPSITMEKADHEKTLSHISNSNCRQYIDNQAKRLIYYGDIISILLAEITFIRRTFGNKYDRAIDEVKKYITYLHFRHINLTTLIMNHPEYERLHFKYRFA